MLFGLPVVQYIFLFFMFSFFGYILECIILSIENKTFVYDRGFTHTPFCIIYGFGATGAYIFLSPVAHNIPLLFLMSAILASVMELVTAKLMLRLFGGFWWNYSMKRFNYKGIICLETSIGWGILGIVFFYFLDGMMRKILGYIPERIGNYIAVIVFVVYVGDFIYCLYHRLKYPDEQPKKAIGHYQAESQLNNK